MFGVHVYNDNNKIITTCYKAPWGIQFAADYAQWLAHRTRFGIIIIIDKYIK